MASDLDYIMKDVEVIISDEENTWYGRKSLVRVGFWRGMKHLFSTGRMDRLKKIDDVVRSYRQGDSEGVTNLLMEMADDMDENELDRVGKNLVNKRRDFVVRFFKRYPAKRALLTRDPYIISYYTLCAAEEEGIPFDAWVTNDAIVENGKITGELRLHLSDRVEEVLEGSQKEMLRDPIKTAESKHLWYDFLIEDVFKVPHKKARYLHDNGAHERSILEEHPDEQLPVNELEELMKPYMPRTLTDELRELSKSYKFA